MTQEIAGLLDNGTTTGSVTLNDVTLGSFLSSSSVTVSFQNISQSGSDWSGTISVSASSASLAIGSAVSAQINGENGGPGITGSYTLADQPAGQGAYQLSANQFDLTLSNLLTAQASDIAIDYSPTAAAGQELAQIGSFSATLLPFDNATAIVDNLDISDNGFTLGDGFVTASSITLGNILTIDQPSLMLSGVGYTGGEFTGTIGLSSSSTSLFPGQSNFTATATNPSGTYTVASQTLALTASSFDLKVGNIFEATSTPTPTSTPALSFTLNDSQSPPAATFNAQNLTLKSADFPNATGTLTDLSASNTGFTIGSATLADTGDAMLGNILDLTNPSLNVNSFAYTVGSGGAITVGGTISVGANSVTMFPGQTSFTTTVGGFNASYDIDSKVFAVSATSFDLKAGNIFEATSTPTSTNTPVLSFTLDDSQSPPAVTFDAQNLTLKSADFPNATGTLTDLSASNTGFTIGSATLAYTGDAMLGNILDLTNPSLNVNSFAYTVGSGGAITVGGTISVGADSVTMFPGQTSFTTTVGGFNASYDIDSKVFAVSATSFDLKAGNIFEATSTPTPTNTPVLSFTLDDSQSPPAVTFDAQNLTLKSADFPNATGTLTDLSASNAGFTIGSASLSYSGPISLGGVLSITGLRLGVENFSYTTATDGASPAVGGTIDFGAQSVSLFAGQSAFTATISDPTGQSPSGLSGSYDINTQVSTLQLDEVDIKVSDLLDVTADNVALNVAQGSFSMTVGSATASVPKLAGFQGSVQNLGITSDGFTVGSASLGFKGTITLGSVLTISNPSAMITGLSYSIMNGAQFNGDVSFGLSASLNVGKVASASVSNLKVTLGLTQQDYGQFLVTADSASFTLGSYLTLTATSTASTPLEFNTAATSGQDIVQFGTVTAQLNAGPLSVSATGQDFGIDSSGNFVALPGFGIQLSGKAAPGFDANSQLLWPNLVPITLNELSLSWPDFNADPTNFSIDVSAYITTSLAGLTLSGNVQNAVFNVGDLASNQFALTSLSGAGFQVGGTFAGVTFDAGGFLATTTDPNGQTILYGGIDGGVSIAGLAGFQIMLGLSSLGPLDIYAMVDAPIILDPDTGLAITGLSAGINFGGGLTTPDSAKDLTQVAQSVFAPTLSQWESQLATDVADQISSGATWANPPTLLTIQGGATLFDAYASPDAFELSGNIAFDTTGKLLASGTVTLGSEIKVEGSVFIDLSQVASGKAELLMNVTAPADTPIVTAYGSVNFEFDGPVFNAVQVPTGSSTPQLGDGLVLDGSTGYGSAPNIDLNNTSYTVEFWAQRDATGQEEYVIGQGPSSSTTGLSIGFDTNNDFVVNSDGKTLSFPAGQDTSWHQWAVTFDMTTGTLSIYRDGVLEASDTAAPIEGASTTLLLGKSGSILFGGGVDEVRVWTVARTAAQIENNLALQTPSPTTGLLADWSFSEGQGTTAADSSGNGNTMTLTGGVTWRRPSSPAPARCPRGRFPRPAPSSSMAPMPTRRPAGST